MRLLAQLTLCGLLAVACSESAEPDAGALEPLPTAEQARIEAAAEIGPENADEEFERLKREIEADS